MRRNNQCLKRDVKILDWTNMGSGQSMETVVNGDWEHRLCWMDRSRSPRNFQKTHYQTKVERKKSGIELDRLDGGCKSSAGALTTAMDGGGSDKPKILVTMSSEDKQTSAE